jgi:hypothetical protein
MDEHGGRVEDAALAEALLAGAGIHPSERELASLGRLLPGLRRQVDRLYAVDTGDAAPAAHLRAAEVTGWPEGAEDGGEVRRG